MCNFCLHIQKRSDKDLEAEAQAKEEAQNEIDDEFKKFINSQSNSSKTEKTEKHDGWRTKKAREYANQFKKNERLQIALSIVAEGLLETTEYGELLTNVREGWFKWYGDQKSQELSATYSDVIGVIKEIKSSLGGDNKLTDLFIYKTSAGLFAKATQLEFRNQILSCAIKNLDINIYTNYKIDPSDPDNVKGGGFSGGGAGNNRTGGY